MAGISIDKSLFRIEGLEYYGKVNLLKGGIVFSDFVSTVSQKYAEEIQTDEFGHGLEGVLRSRADHLVGILNGVDYEDWNPATDKLIPANYNPEDMKGKEICKKLLLQKLGAQNPDLGRPVLGIVSRFVRQKGFDLIAQVADELMREDLYITALGTGEPEYEELFRSLAEKYPEKFLVRVAYDNALAHQIEAGADMFLMPSRYEPCGLNQIYSMKYGTVPVVRATGGLDDTVQPFDGERGTGFRFRQYSPVALLACLQRAIATFRDRDAWSKLQQNCMQEDFSWTQSASKYASLYESLYAGRTQGTAAQSYSIFLKFVFTWRIQQMAGGNILEFSDQNFEQEVLGSDKPVLVDFWAEWCAPCRMIAPAVEAIAGEYAGRAKVGKLNVDENQSVTSRYNIRSIPTLLLFKNGEIKEQLVGATSKDNLAKLLDKNL